MTDQFHRFVRPPGPSVSRATVAMQTATSTSGSSPAASGRWLWPASPERCLSTNRGQGGPREVGSWSKAAQRPDAAANTDSGDRAGCGAGGLVGSPIARRILRTTSWPKMMAIRCIP